MRWHICNAILGLSSAAATWFVGTLEYIETGLRIAGLAIGVAAATYSLLNARRAWLARNEKEHADE